MIVAICDDNGRQLPELARVVGGPLRHAPGIHRFPAQSGTATRARASNETHGLTGLTTVVNTPEVTLNDVTRFVACKYGDRCSGRRSDA